MITAKILLGLAKAFIILAKYSDEKCAFDINNNIIYVQIDPKKLTNNDAGKLEELGWKKDLYYEGMSWVDTSYNEKMKLNKIVAS